MIKFAPKTLVSGTPKVPGPKVILLKRQRKSTVKGCPKARHSKEIFPHKIATVRSREVGEVLWPGAKRHF